MRTYPPFSTAGQRRRPPGAWRTLAAAGSMLRALPAPCAPPPDHAGAIGRLAASIAHEVDQPLAAIVLHAQLALRCIERAATAPSSMAGGDGAAACAALQALLAASRDASDIVGSMRALAGATPPVRVRCRLDEACDAVLAGAAADLARLGIECSVAFGRGARTALAAPVQLRQLLRNLVANAIDALRGVTGRARLLRIEARLDRAGGLRLSVSDNGVGLDAVQARRVFDPLVTTKASGLGLGLAICRSIVAAHGGRIWAEPLPVHGCMFTCLLPHASGADLARGRHD